MISVFEVVSAYFIDTYFNHVYQNAISPTPAAHPGLPTDAFIRRVEAFNRWYQQQSTNFSNYIIPTHESVCMHDTDSRWTQAFDDDG